MWIDAWVGSEKESCALLGWFLSFPQRQSSGFPAGLSSCFMWLYVALCGLLYVAWVESWSDPGPSPVRVNLLAKMESSVSISGKLTEPTRNWCHLPSLISDEPFHTYVFGRSPWLQKWEIRVSSFTRAGPSPTPTPCSCHYLDPEVSVHRDRVQLLSLGPSVSCLKLRQLGLKRRIGTGVRFPCQDLGLDLWHGQTTEVFSILWVLTCELTLSQVNSYRSDVQMISHFSSD